VTPFDKVTGVAFKKSEGPPAYTKVFGEAVVELARLDKRIVGITAAMPDGTGLDQLQRAIPEQFYDVGIAEQHGVTVCCRPRHSGVPADRRHLLDISAKGF
jgi:1-deoxy-D-xylulose-5-phosphate synthase